MDERVHKGITALVDSFRYTGMDTKFKMQPGLEYTASRPPQDFERYFLPRDIVRRFFTKRGSASLPPFLPSSFLCGIG